MAGKLNLDYVTTPWGEAVDNFEGVRECVPWRSAVLFFPC